MSAPTAPDGLRHCGYPPEVYETPTEIARFRSSGIRTFRIGSVEVTVAHCTNRHTDEGTDEDALVGQVAEWCRDSAAQFARADATARHNAAKWESTKADLFAKIDRLQAQLHAERERHPERPVRVIGPLCVRMRAGELWALNKREHGWSSSGFLVGSWDELFRRWDVLVTEQGVDRHGPYWMCEPTKIAEWCERGGAT